MNQEKMQILKMLEEGKISAEDASRLLSTVDGKATKEQGRPDAHTSNANNQKPPSSTYREESLIDEISRKFGTFMKDMEPKVRKFTQVAVEKTATAADSISKGISSRTTSGELSKPSFHGSFPQAPTTHKPSIPTPSKGIEEMIEIVVTQKGAELNLNGLNGQVLIKGYNGDKISAKIFTVAKRAGASASLAALGNKYYLNFNEADFDRVCIDAFVPESMFDNIRVATINGNISASSLSTQNIKIENTNGNSELSSVTAANIVVENNNGTTKLTNVVADISVVENFNGAISVYKTDIENLKLTTFNGSIDMQIAAFDNFNNYNWQIETSNESLNLILPSYATLGYYVKAHAALDNVKLGLIGMNYIRNETSFVEAKSINYEASFKKVNLNLETSNAPLIIN